MKLKVNKCCFCDSRNQGAFSTGFRSVINHNGRILYFHLACFERALEYYRILKSDDASWKELEAS